ncbi:FAD binding domain-containing protein [Desulfoscipio sp. XC116]|uniref:FAD binding domain-containing protein n=1 Tax=Desulfoscipio sp. XC116 TaxID=3144975 RepID=UPI00325BD709
MLKDYLFPETVSEAVSILNNKEGQARIIAGGTDLLLDIPAGKIKTSNLVDISRISELSAITLEEGMISIGAAVTHNRAAESELIREKAAALAQAASCVGSYQIRNSATVIGNVCNAQPAADTAVALVALGAVAEIAASGGTESVPVEKMYAGVGRSTVDSSRQLVTKVSFPAAQKGQGTAFVRLQQRKALALPMLNVAAMVALEDGKFAWARISMAPVGPGPVRALNAEQILNGAEVTPEVIEKAAQAALEQANPRSSALRGSKEYRTSVLPTLIRRALEQAVANAGGSIN